MAVDYPRAWQLAKAAPMEAHDPKCSYRKCLGGFLCDCHVLYQHPEYLKQGVLYTTDGVVFTDEMRAALRKAGTP